MSHIYTYRACSKAVPVLVLGIFQVVTKLQTSVNSMLQILINPEQL